MPIRERLPTIDLSGAEPRWTAELEALWAKAARRAVAHARESVTSQRLAHDLGVALGSQSALYVTHGVRSVVPLLATMRPRAVVESPTFLDVPRLLERHGCSIEHASDEDLPDLLVDPARTLVWVTSPGRNPDGRTIGGRLRQALEDFASRGGLVVQNESYRFSCRSAPTTIPGAVSVGSLHKLAGSWSGIGWISGDLPAHLAAEAPYFGPRAMWQALWADFLFDGGLALLGRQATEVADQVRQFAAAAGWSRSGDGPTILMDGPYSETIDWLAFEFGILVNPGTAFGGSRNQVRLSFTPGLTEQEFQRVVRAASDLGLVDSRHGG